MRRLPGTRWVIVRHRTCPGIRIAIKRTLIGRLLKPLECATHAESVNCDPIMFGKEPGTTSRTRDGLLCGP